MLFFMHAHSFSMLQLWIISNSELWKCLYTRYKIIFLTTQILGISKGVSYGNNKFCFSNKKTIIFMQLIG